ncbi:ABC transmembrane type-1 domain-containing protein [Hyphomicrobiales bacterium]|nr:ABC transmembrane type-1 domain-containing protein [Hyphomicrobiales bacterium]CAH1694004.1 ABC transmembrane type-1 domain-containing protein [Hyphomicrobiales bacterium]
MFRQDKGAWGLVLPFLAIEFIFVAVPLGIGGWMSLHRVDFLKVKNFVGLQNYWDVINSPVVLNSLWLTTYFTFFALFFTFIVGFSLALFLERDGRLQVFGRAVVLVPFTISMLIGSMLLKWIFSREGGLLPLALQPLGMADASILADPSNAMGALVFNAMWRDAAHAMILLMAGLKSVPLQLYDAARVDGAGPVRRFVRITLPMMRLPILITCVRLILHFANILTFPLILTGGGPNDATNIIGLQLYRTGFQDFRLGIANAFALIVFVVNIALIMVVIRLFRAKEESQA